jgi:peptidoglycan/LPS O-acetylase OafA/YrhL
MVHRRIQGLDSLRFLAALSVAFSHGAGLPPLKPLLQGSGFVGHIIAKGNGLLFNGVAAVIVFFVISGFCIHFPWVGASHINTRSHLTRRYIRLGIPLIACHAIMHFSSDKVAGAANAVLWSIYCEIIYYTLYPFLFYLFRQVGIKGVIFVSTIISLFLIITHWSYLLPWEFGIRLTWLVWLPSWLLGCLLAEQVAHHQKLPSHSIWLWRGAALIFSAATVAAVSHLPIPLGYPVTILVFSFYCYFWLQHELAIYSDKAPPAFFEWGGTWSYSMYLIHNMVIAAFAHLYFLMPFLISWTVQLLAIFLASYAFYVTVEYPSHLLARRLGRAASRPIPAAI